MYLIQYQKLINKQAELGMWRKKNGEYINIQDMSTEYILNCIHVCYEMNEEGTFSQWIHRFYEELDRRKA